MRPFFNLKTTADTVRVTGSFFNRSHEADDLRQPPIRNISGVIAPYEDALCILAAKRTGKPALREVATALPPNSRYVTNYLRRGYERESDDQERTGMIRKSFPS